MIRSIGWHPHALYAARRYYHCLQANASDCASSSFRCAPNIAWVTNSLPGPINAVDAGPQRARDHGCRAAIAVALLAGTAEPLTREDPEPPARPAHPGELQRVARLARARLQRRRARRAPPDAALVDAAPQAQHIIHCQKTPITSPRRAPRRLDTAIHGHRHALCACLRGHTRTEGQCNSGHRFSSYGVPLRRL